MERRDDEDMELEPSADASPQEGETHATTGGAAAAGAVTGGVIGLTGGPLGAAIGAVGGAIVGVAAERMMHSDDDAERARDSLETTHAPATPERAEDSLLAESQPLSGTMGRDEARVEHESDIELEPRSHP